MAILAEISENIVNLHRYTKRTIAILIDIGLCIFCTWLAFYLRLEQFVKINEVTTLAVEISVLLAIPIFWLMGLYKTIFRFQGSSIIFTVFIATFAYTLFIVLIADKLGFLISIFLFTLVTPMLWQRKDYIKIFFYSLTISVFVFVFFTLVLQLKFPQGILEEFIIKNFY